MTPILHFVGGLPRSGSTLLQNLLAQNPAHFVTPTSGLINMITGIKNSWPNVEAFQAQGLSEVQPRIAASLRALTYGFYERELSQGRIVFDKSRGWLQHIELLEEIYQRPVKVISLVRDVRAVAASFEKLHRQHPLARRDHLGPTYFEAQTIEGRARVLFSPSGIVGLPINFLRDALNRGVSDRVVVIRYHDLASKPQETLDWLHAQLGLPRFTYDPENVKQVTKEDDAIFGWGPNLHTIRSKVEQPSEAPWAGVLSPRTTHWLCQEFQDIQQLAYSSPLAEAPSPGEEVHGGS